MPLCTLFLTGCEKAVKKALKRVFHGLKVVAGAGFVPRHAEIVTDFG